MDLGPQSHAAPQLVEPDPTEHHALDESRRQGNLEGRDASIPDLMQEFRAGVQDALSWLDAARPEPARDVALDVSPAPADWRGADPVRPRISPDLLERITLTLSEVRQALGELRVTHEPNAWASERAPAASPEVQSARRIALNMALNGAQRSETERYLQRNFTLQDGTEIAADAYRRAQRSG